ncbi:MAG: SHOCT domain-containing protein [Chloroflexi bacterium]|nr:SHOCT domain-containing protein [Chloroflexota bacterium]
MMGPGMMGGFGGMWLMPLIPIVIVGLVVWAIVAAVQGAAQPRGSEPSYGDSALELLKRRYARGEINREEFEEKRKDLL